MTKKRKTAVTDVPEVVPDEQGPDVLDDDEEDVAAAPGEEDDDDNDDNDDDGEADGEDEDTEETSKRGGPAATVKRVKGGVIPKEADVDAGEDDEEE